MEAKHRPILIAGHFDRSTSDVIARASQAAGFNLDSIQSAGEMREWLAQDDPIAVLLPADHPDAENICLAVRANPRHALVAIIAIASEMTDLTFADVFGWGGDDAVSAGSIASLERRLRLLPADLPPQLPQPRGTVAVACTHDRKRVLLARLLRNAGFDVRFALDGDELVSACDRTDVTLAHVEVDIPPTGAIGALNRATNRKVPWVIAAPPKQFGPTLTAAMNARGVAVYDSFAPLENALFLVNEALRGSFGENRATPRLLYGATVAFRLGGRDRDELGFVYNISADGLYVRTLLPLSPGDDAWIELQPPRTDRRVRLEARVVWHRLFGPAQGATVPPGFGLRITGGSESDLKRYRQGYESFAHDLAAIRSTARP